MTDIKEIEKSLIKKYRKELWSPFIKAVKEFNLIEEGDKVGVAISGGKDSLILAKPVSYTHLPESAQEKPQYAEVVAISADIENDEKKKDNLKVGDKVIYSQYAGTDVKLDGEEFIVVKYNDILAAVSYTHLSEYLL